MKRLKANLKFGVSKENKTTTSLKKQLVVLIFVSILLPIMIVVFVLFYQTGLRMREQTINTVGEGVTKTMANIDEMLVPIYNMSSKIGLEPVVERYMRTSYGEEDRMEKLTALNRMNRLFESYNQVGPSASIAVICSRTGQIFNFVQPSNDGEEIRSRLQEMGVTDSSRLSSFCWYPPQEDFISVHKEQGAQTSRDRILIGSRRVIKPLTGEYLGTHIFTIPEKDLYEKYRVISMESKGEFYVVDGTGNILSSSNEEQLVNRVLEPNLMQEIQNHEEDCTFEMNRDGVGYIVSVSYSRINDWKTVAVIPVREVTREMDSLFLKIFLALFLCTLLCVLLLNIITDQFLKPVTVINHAMEKVYNGDRNAYVYINSRNEIGNMANYYNAMLCRINQYIKEEYEIEKKKKELEMEVLMGQVNPHFLYNTLETLVWKANERGSPDIGRIAASLGRMYRLSIGTGKLIVEIPKEIEHLMAYINIQKARYKERFWFDLRVNNEEIARYKTLKLILQPTVENAIMYAMDGIEHPLGIRLRIVIREKEIQFVVVDNGSGMDREHLEAVRVHIVENDEKRRKNGNCSQIKGTGIGLRSVSERIRLYFNKENAVKIFSKQGKGTKIVITIPKVGQND